MRFTHGPKINIKTPVVSTINAQQKLNAKYLSNPPGHKAGASTPHRIIDFHSKELRFCDDNNKKDLIERNTFIQDDFGFTKLVTLTEQLTTLFLNLSHGQTSFFR